MSVILSILLALLLIGIMVMVHEAGHFFAARACGIPVRSFGIGFGPKICAWKGKSGTEYVLRVFPGGGYCGFYGEDDTTGQEARTDSRAITLQKPWKRLITLFAGPFMNIVLAFAATLAFYGIYGLPYAGDKVESRVVSVQKGSPADESGFQAGDVLLSVNGRTVTDNFSEEMNAWDGGEPLLVEVRRGEETAALRVKPDFISTENRYMIGVTLDIGLMTQWRHEGIGKTLSYSFETCTRAAGAVLEAFKNLFTRGEGLDQMSGPVGVIRIIAQETQAYRLMGYMNMLIVISINLGLLNLLPIPGLDGGRILFVLYEIIFRKPVNRRVEAYIHLGGYAVLLFAMLYFTFHDVLSIFG